MSKFKDITELSTSLTQNKQKVEKELEIEFLRKQISSLQRNGHLHDQNIALLLQMMQVELDRQ
jgi:hypothetical protein